MRRLFKRVLLLSCHPCPSISCVLIPAPEDAVCGCQCPLGPGSCTGYVALHPLGQPVFDEAIVLYVRLGVLAMGGVLVVYGNKTTAVIERTEDERTETTICLKAVCYPFQKCW